MHCPLRHSSQTIVTLRSSTRTTRPGWVPKAFPSGFQGLNIEPPRVGLDISPHRQSDVRSPVRIAGFALFTERGPEELRISSGAALRYFLSDATARECE